MTTYTTYKTPTGDEVAIMTNPGAAPIVYLNGVIQSPRDYRISGTWVLFNKKYDWQPVTIIWPKKINGRWYWPGQQAVRRYVLSPSGGNWLYGDVFDILKSG